MLFPNIWTLPPFQRNCHHWCTTRLVTNMLHDCRPAEAWLPYDILLTVTENAQRVEPELTARSCTPELWVPGSLENSRVVWIITNPFCIRCCKFWTSLTSVAEPAQFQMTPDIKTSKGIIPGERAGNAVGPPCPTHLYGDILFENPPYARRKCGWPLTCMNHKWFFRESPNC